MSHYFNWPLFSVIVCVFVLPTVLAVISRDFLQAMRLRKRAKVWRPTSYTFTTPDCGRTWYNEGRFMHASPLTDALQDYYTERQGRLS